MSAWQLPRLGSLYDTLDSKYAANLILDAKRDEVLVDSRSQGVFNVEKGRGRGTIDGRPGLIVLVGRRFFSFGRSLRSKKGRYRGEGIYSVKLESIDGVAVYLGKIRRIARVDSQQIRAKLLGQLDYCLIRRFRSRAVKICCNIYDE